MCYVGLHLRHSTCSSEGITRKVALFGSQFPRLVFHVSTPVPVPERPFVAEEMTQCASLDMLSRMRLSMKGSFLPTYIYTYM